MMRTAQLKIDGMTCSACATGIANRLNVLKGVNITISHPEGSAVLSVNSDITLKSLLGQIEQQGYQVTVLGQQQASIKHDSPLPEKTPQTLHIAIIGTGSGAFACALKAAENGAKVTLIERKNVIGGTCVNIGCIPSKIMIHAAYIAHIQQHHAFKGIKKHRALINRKQLLQQQQNRVDELRIAKYENILQSNPNINLIKGTARFKNPNTLIVDQTQGQYSEISADRILIATGASAAIPDIAGLAQTPYWTSTQALQATSIPKHLMVIGSSIVALELAQAYLRLGSKVTLLARNSILSGEDADIGNELHKILQAEGMRILPHTQAKTIIYSKGIFCKTRFTIKTSNEQTLTADQLLMATGRLPNTRNLGLEHAGVETIKDGSIRIDDHMRTNVKHIYAAGDCSTQAKFVYVAAAAGTRAAINMTGGDSKIDLSAMPSVMFTDPQMATVGLSEAEAKHQNIATDSRLLALHNVPRALTNFSSNGFIKLVQDKNNGRLIGAQILAPDAGEMIQTAVLAIHNKMTIEELSEQLFPYLTMVEGIKLCAQSFNKNINELSCCAG